jgi:hypothetical protein
MNRIATSFRVTAFALAAVIASTLFSTLVGSMPPDFAGAPNEARNDRADRRIEVAIVPSRIEVVGVRDPLPAAVADGVQVREPRT